MGRAAASIAIMTLAAEAIACGIDAMGTATGLALPDDATGEGGTDASGSNDADAALDVIGETAPDARDAVAEDAEPPIVACSEPGGVRAANHCYFPIAPTTVPLAKQTCLAAGAHLVTVTSAAEHTVLATVGTGDRWIGLEAPAPSNDRAQYQWVTAEAKTVSYWYVNDPDSMGPCVALHGTLQEWVDRACSDTNPAICERE